MKRKYFFVLISFFVFILMTTYFQCGSGDKKSETSSTSSNKNDKKQELRTTTPTSKELASIIVGFDGYKFKRIKGDPLIKDNSVTVPFASSVMIRNTGMKSFYVGSDAFEVQKGKEYFWKYADGQLDLNIDKKVLSKRDTYCFVKAVKF